MERPRPAYQSNEGNDGYQIFIRPFPDIQKSAYQISFDGGQHPIWNRTSNELFYKDPSHLVSVIFNEVGSLQWGEPEPLFDHRPYRHADNVDIGVSREGSRFLMTRDVKRILWEELVYVTNWAQQLP